MADTSKKQQVKDYFQPGDIPTSAEFNELIDLATSATAIDTGTVDPIHIPPLHADKIHDGEFDANRIPALNADKLASGTLTAERIPVLDAAKITTGTLSTDRIPSLPAATINSGELTTDRIPALDTSKITSGVFTSERIPPLNADRITSGSLSPERIPPLDASKIATGTVDADRLPAASEANIGTVHYATAEELTAGTETAAVSAKHLKEADNAIRLYVDTQTNTLQASLTHYSLARYAIEGSRLVFSETTDHSYTINIPDAIAYKWHADGITITSANNVKNITVSTGFASGTLFVKVTTASGAIIERSADIYTQIASGSRLFSATGALQTWQVPVGIHLITLECWGAQGGHNHNGSHVGGYGGYAKGERIVAGGELLNLYVGTRGGNAPNTSTNTYTPGGWNGGGAGGYETNTATTHGGGGGGSTDIRLAGTQLEQRIIVSAGGGGAANQSNGGHGGGLTGSNGQAANGSYGQGGGGGTQSAGGSAYTGRNAGVGTLGQGGMGSFAMSAWAGGGGGGGYYGGGGGSSTQDHGSGYSGGGGGGSSFMADLQNTTTTAGVREGDGQIIISW